MKALIGFKRGMLQLFQEDGTRLPITVIDVPPNVITAVRTAAAGGRDAVQLGAGETRAKCLSKPRLGALAKAGLPPLRHLREFAGEPGERKVGDRVAVQDVFQEGQRVDVVGTSKGHGFTGAIKRHNFSRGPMAHGSQFHRRPGSIGMHRYPHRTLPGKRMAGRMGFERVTVRGLRVVGVDAEAGQLLIKGPVPGCAGSLVVVRQSNIKGR